MPRFLLLLAPEPLAGSEWSAAELGARTERFVAWVDAMRSSGALREGARLDSHAGRLLRERGGGRGPAQVEVVGPVGHYFVIDARDWPAALAWADRCPGAQPGAIDVYRVDEDTLLLPAAAP